MDHNRCRARGAIWIVPAVVLVSMPGCTVGENLLHFAADFARSALAAYLL